MAKKSLTGLLLLAVTASLWGSGNPWGNLKKMYFYSSVNNLEQVRRNLAELSSESTSRREKEEIAGQLLQLADHYFQTKNYALAREFYQKILVLSPDAWAVFNSLEMIERAQGRKLINPVYAWQQLHHSLRNFDSSYLLVSNFFNVLFFAWLLVFFLFTMVEFVKYFKLAINDCALNRKREFSLLRLFLVIVFFLWPIVVVGGWGIYPFLIAGFLWGYLNGYEKTVCRWILGLLLFFSLLLAFNRYLARSVTSEPFDLARRIYEGELLAEKSSHPPLDNQLKVLQAYTLYEHRQFAGALELLNTVDKNYRSILKFNLLGSIFFENGNIGQSMQYFREALGINDKDPTTLKNFTLALLKSNDPKMLDSYRGRYPQIGLYKQSVQSLEKLSIPERFLWKRALSFGQPTFPAWDFFKILVLEFVKLPVLACLLLLGVYIGLFKKVFPRMGQSTFCGKCSKIIKKAAFEQVHVLCDECYQLFLIKDPIFYEAKVIKEKEINRQWRRRFALQLAISLLIPGFYLNFREKTKLFVFLSGLFFLLGGYFVFTSLLFHRYFGTVPLFLNLMGMATFFWYLLVNIYAVSGDENGF